jgi:hypothetical protein
MAFSLLRRTAKLQKNPRLGRKCVVFWIPETRKRALYDRAKLEKKTIQSILNELVRNYLEGRPAGPNAN